MPGHCMAALVARPSLSCAGKPIPVGRGGTAPLHLEGAARSPTAPGARRPSPFSRTCSPRPWRCFRRRGSTSAATSGPRGAWEVVRTLCQQRIRDQKLANEDELQSWFVRRIERFLNAKGRRLIGWDEILQGGLAPNATVMSWRGVGGRHRGRAGMAGHDVIMSPHLALLLRLLAGATRRWSPPGAATGSRPELVYDFEPVPEALTGDPARPRARRAGERVDRVHGHAGTRRLHDLPAPPGAGRGGVDRRPERRSWDGFSARASARTTPASPPSASTSACRPPPDSKGMNLITEGSVTRTREPRCRAGVIRWVRGRRVPKPGRAALTRDRCRSRRRPRSPRASTSRTAAPADR